MKKLIVLFMLGIILLFPFLVFADYDVESAKNYLLAHADNPWSTMALVVLGANSIPTDHLKSINGTKAIDFAAPILAITALNQNPRSFGNIDYIAELKKYYLDDQIGDAGIINDDIFGLLALIAAGEPATEPIIIGVKNFILSRQQPNGGWGLAVSGGTDSNITAAAMVALMASGVSATDSKIQNGFSYLKTTQNEDGGFTYDLDSQFGTASDSSSTAWVLWALNAAGINPNDWLKSGNSPVNYLESNQASSGYFKYQSSSLEDAFSPVTTAYVVIALAGKTLPLHLMSNLPKFSFRIEGKSNTVCSGETEGPTALDIVKNASQQCDFIYHIQSTSFGPYLDQIGDDKAASMTGWLYLVNYLTASVGAADYILKSGDSVLWYYGDFDWKPIRLSLTETQIASGESSTATVEYFSASAWSPLAEAKVYFGTNYKASDSGGKATITTADGYYQVLAKKDGYIRSNSLLLKVGNPSGNEVSLKVNIQKIKVAGATLSFIVEPSSLDFGTLNPGQSGSKNLSIKNNGTVNLMVEGVVSGDDIFVSNLSLDSVSWKSFKKQVATDQTQAVTAGLTVPNNYSADEGAKAGSITFWAVAKE